LENLYKASAVPSGKAPLFCRKSIFHDQFRMQTAHVSRGLLAQGEVKMAGQVVLYFEDQADALRFALAAGSVMSGDGAKFTTDLVQETSRITRIRLDAVNAGSGKKSGNGRVA
jgi:hypothetical protein